jgi:hypothetical protein
MKQTAALAALLASAALLCVREGLAQTQPTPGPTFPPSADQPLAKPGADMVINPTLEECRKGWNETLKWSKEQFDAYCLKLKTAK